MKKTKVLFIWHAAVVESYQQYIAELAKYEDLDITLLIPQYSFEGSKNIKAFMPKNSDYKVIVGFCINPQDPLLSIYPLLPYYLFKVKPDLVHLFEEPYHNIATYLNFWMNMLCPKAKLVFQTFQNQVEKYRAPWIKAQNNTFKRSSAAIACSEEIKQVLLYWGYKKPIHVIYPGIETELFSSQDPSNIRKSLGLKTFTIGYFGRMIKGKGVEDLLAASNHLNFDHQLLMVGNGKDRDYFKNLTNKAVWIDAVDPQEINQYYNALNVLILPSRTTKNWKEQFGRVLVEAMLCGVPVIGSSSGEIPNVIGDAGLVFKEQDVNDLAQKISQIHGDQKLRQILIEKGLKRGKEFDWSIVAKKVYTVYKEL